MSSLKKRKDSPSSVLLFDTDFLIKAANNPLPELSDILRNSEYKLVTLNSVKRELEGLSQSRKPAVSRKARLARAAVGTSIAILPIPSDSRKGAIEADAVLLEFSEFNQGRVIIATLDGSLLSKLEKRQLPYLTLRKDKPFFRTFSQQHI